MSSKSTVHHIVQTLGRENIESRLGVSKYSLFAAKRDRLFPAAWFDVLDEMCRERGIECPRSAFRFRSSESAA